jgi:hypothetical protein
MSRSDHDPDRIWGMIAALDTSTRAISAQFEIRAPVSTTKLVLGRTPDFEGPGLISWGNLTYAEAHLLVVRTSDPEDRDLDLEVLEELPRPSEDGSLRWTLYLRGGHGQ